ncbi:MULTISPECIES: hypothetical protein [Phyllobacteriaceae]|uniref:Lipoprotein n=2 Tax=Pseudomonadota TaxID=1224 RepID=A0A1C2EBS4_9HYPH|nr:MULTISPECIES: hypothetical protein [Mesorhizobium]MBN9237608.1 hypothetical protein [Mesorhizobium sp.]MDQ0331765.1 hypothetical protein [Mesorhizobium sp. YL-MeA3-2017]OCX24492.1 hypothetical protein QV13_02030 [Mesorhizobium hungaricum]
MKAKIHAAAGSVALLAVVCFWLSTAVAEISGDADTVAAVKSGILVGMVVLVPAMAIAGASGFSLGKGWKSPVVARKKRRMRVIAANGMLILLPSAYLLAGWAGQGRFDAVFMMVQALELAAGAVNIVLLSLNMRDGLALRRRPSAVVRAG